MSDLAAAQKALDKAKVQMMAKPDTVFWCTICFSMRHVLDYRVQTAQTDGKTIWYNPDFFMKQTPDQRLGLLMHEVMHVAYGHVLRLGDRDMMKWNKATDYVINLQIISRSFKLPEGGLLDWGYKDMAAEKVYKLLPDEPEPPPMGGGTGDDDGDGSSGPGQAPPESHMAPPPDDGTADGVQQAQQAKERLDDMLIRAALQSEMAGEDPGNIPGEIALYIKSLLKPKLPTRQLLKRFFDDVAQEDYSWTRPNRRYMPDIYLPHRFSEGMGHIGIAVDSSGSVSDDEFKRFVSEVAHVIKTAKPKKLSLITFDCTIQSVHEIRTVQELLKVEFTGRGGTKIGPVLEWEAQHKPKVMLVFSDGCFHFPSGEFGKGRRPYLWAIHDRPGFEAPFGRVVHYNMED